MFTAKENRPMEVYDIQKIQLASSWDRSALESLLQSQGLRLDHDVETAFGVYETSGEEPKLVGCGCAAGALLKCFALLPQLRGQNLLGRLVSALTQDRFAAGYYDLMVITRAHNETLFVNSGFWTVAKTEQLVLLENQPDGPARFTAPMVLPGDEDRSVGAIVMNCNPFTKGHLALITYAASRCSLLHIFVVEEDRSLFPFEVRMRLVKEGTAHLPNVKVHPSGPYMISSATFPTYFLKKSEDAARIQSELDITLFASRIAPLFHITKRFAGEEPLDPVTRDYNEAMIRLLPQYSISFIKIARTTAETPEGRPEVISASKVRKLLAETGVTEEVLQLVPPCTAPDLKNEFGARP